MNANRIHRYGPPDVIDFEEIERPAPGPGEVLLRVQAAGRRALGRLDTGRQELAVRVGTVLPLAEGRQAHEMLEGMRRRPPGKIVLRNGRT
jgi:NADPH:quinone reductase-like Zn-dependent oxidoreductase